MNRYNKLLAQFKLLAAIRSFFQQHDFLDVMTPPVVTNPGMETHIHPFALYSVANQKLQGSYLHTSPEFHMKELLSLGFDKIFTLGYCFRDEPQSSIHRSQFIMLEWYRSQTFYTKIMDDVEQLINYAIEQLSAEGILINSSLKDINFPRTTVQELFLEFTRVDILNFLERDELYDLIAQDFPHITLPAKNHDQYSWDDLYFLLFLNEIEPQLKHYPYLLIYNFPHHLSALSTINKQDARVCDRFEVYLQGIELCNCFNELEDLAQQQARFQQQAQEKLDLYGYQLPPPQILYTALARGINQSSGIALGVERLLKALTNIENTFWD